jgi:predicted NodU family carbamoyl transferase
MEHVYWGPRFSSDAVAEQVAALELDALDFRGREAALLEATVDRLAAGRVVAWFHGAMEFGPRALGARSILADPRVPDMRDRVNRLVKHREAFRPFAPSVLRAHAAEHFELDHASPFMLQTCRVRRPGRCQPSRMSMARVTAVARPRAAHAGSLTAFAAYRVSPFSTLRSTSTTSRSCVRRPTRSRAWPEPTSTASSSRTS